MVRRWILPLVAMSVVAAGCSDSATSGSTGLPAATSPSTAGGDPLAPEAPSKQVNTSLVSLRVPETWQGVSTGSGDVFGPVVHVWRGYAIGRLNVVPFAGSIDDLAPQYCAGRGSVPAGQRVPSSVKLEERGFAPVGDKTAEFRRWTAMCANGPESHRAWVLPITKLLFWETCADDRIGPIVTNAAIVGTPEVRAPNDPPPSAVPQNCDDTDRTDTTTGR